MRKVRNIQRISNLKRRGKENGRKGENHSFKDENGNLVLRLGRQHCSTLRQGDNDTNSANSRDSDVPNQNDDDGMEISPTSHEQVKVL